LLCQSDVDVQAYNPPYPRSRLSSFVQAWRVVTRHSPSVKCRVPTFPNAAQLFDAWPPGLLGEVSTSVSPTTVGSTMMQHPSDNLRLEPPGGGKASILEMTLHVNFATGARASTPMRILSIPWFMHPRDCRAEITIVRTRHELALTAKINDPTRVDYASYWSVTYTLLSSPISIISGSFTVAFLVVLHALSCFLGSISLDPRNLVDLPRFRLSMHLLYPPPYPIILLPIPLSSHQALTLCTRLRGLAPGRLLDQRPAISSSS
jgi:hypothetical protein